MEGSGRTFPFIQGTHFYYDIYGLFLRFGKEFLVHEPGSFFSLYWYLTLFQDFYLNLKKYFLFS